MTDLTRLSIETSNLCNLRCIQCLHHGKLYRGQSDGHPRTMELDFYKNIVDEFQDLNPLPKIVTPHFQGEPLCYPEFMGACEYLSKKGIGLEFTTNGMLLTKDLTNFLLELPNFSSICFSLDGFTKETNEKIRVGVKHEKLIENINYFIEASRGRMFPLAISVNMTLMEENRSEYLDFIYHWTSIDAVQVQVCVCTDGEGLPQKLYWRPKERSSCLSPTFFSVVLTNGDVIPCCRDHRYEMVMGNLHKTSLKEVWNGEWYQYLRELQQRRLYNTTIWDQDRGQRLLCTHCDTWMSDYTETMFRYRIIEGRILVKQGPYWEQFRRIR